MSFTPWYWYPGVYILSENSYTFHNFSLNLPPSKKNFCPPGSLCTLVDILPFSWIGGGRKDKEFLVIFRKNKGILSACGQKFHWKLQFYINSYHNFVNISSNPTSKPYTFHNSFLIPSTQKFFIGDLQSPIFHKIYSPAVLWFRFLLFLPFLSCYFSAAIAHK